LKTFATQKFYLKITTLLVCHIFWWKLQCPFGGNYFSSQNGMQGQNWFDVLLHGFPWVLLLISILLKKFDLLTKKDSQ
jgi:hypothetical protein